MKRVIVVVTGRTKEQIMEDSVEIKGNHLEVIDTSTVGGEPKLLVIKDGNENIAVFHQWLYWKKLE